MRRVLGCVLLGLIALAAFRSHDWTNTTSAAISATAQPEARPQLDPRAEIRRNPQNYIEISRFSWSKDGFGSVMLADFVIKNNSDYDIKDVAIKCTHAAPSGTVIDRNERTIYEIVKAKTTKSIRRFNMGFIHSQAARSGCEVVDATLI